MKINDINPRFQIGQKVWSVVGESEKGVVINWMYTRRENTITYQVSFDPNLESKWYFQEELSDSPIFNN